VGGTVSSTRARSVDSRAPRASPRDGRRVVEHFLGRRELNFYDRQIFLTASSREHSMGHFGNGSGAPRTHRAGHAVLRGPLDVNGQGRHGTGVWGRKTRIRFATRAYRPPNDPLPRSRNNFWDPRLTNTPSFECRSNPIACPAPIREGARRVCRTPMTLGVATRSCPPIIDARVCRAPATPRRNGRPRPLEPAGGPVAGYLSDQLRTGDPHKKPEFLESRDPLR
jgi:hypothetical protein